MQSAWEVKREQKIAVFSLLSSGIILEQDNDQDSSNVFEVENESLFVHWTGKSPSQISQNNFCEQLLTDKTERIIKGRQV